MPWVQHTFFFGRNKFTWPSGAREVSRVGKSDRKSARPETRNLRGGLRNGDLLRLKPSHQHRENGADRAGGGLELVAYPAFRCRVNAESSEYPSKRINVFGSELS